MAKEGCELGAHTVTHRDLTALTRVEVEREIKDSVRSIEDLVGDAVVTFAYPKGRWDPSIRTIVGAEGFDVACTVQEGHVPSDPDILALPRVSVLKATTLAQFRAKISRGLALYERIMGR